MVKYSGDHVKVDDGWIVVNGEKAFKPAASGNYTDLERTYLTAGKLAKVLPCRKCSGMPYTAEIRFTAEVLVFSTTQWL